MRIGLFTDSYRPYVSGVVRSIETFTAELSGLGHEVFIFAPAYPDHGRREGNVFRFLSLPAPVRNGFRLGVPLSLRVRGTVAALGLDLIHAHSPFLMGHLGARCARHAGLPLVFTYHTLYHEYAHYVPLLPAVARGVALRWSLAFCNRSDLVIAPSPSIRTFLRTHQVRTPIEVVPTGIFPERFRGRDPGWLRRRFALPEGPVLLYGGRLAREKSLPYLLRAFSRLREAVPAAHLVLVGDGPIAAELRRLAQDLGIASSVTFTGQMVDEDLYNCYAGADVFVFPSVKETQGIVILEAMAAGLPVVARDAFGTRDVIDEGRDGFLCRGGEEDFARLVARLIKDPVLRREMGRAARRKAERLSARAMARRLAAVYEELLGGGKGDIGRASG